MKILHHTSSTLSYVKCAHLRLAAYFRLTAHDLSWPPVQGHLDEAIELFLKALAIFEKVKGESSTEVATLTLRVATLLNNIAGLYEDQVL